MQVPDFAPLFAGAVARRIFIAIDARPSALTGVSRFVVELTAFVGLGYRAGLGLGERSGGRRPTAVETQGTMI